MTAQPRSVEIAFGTAGVSSDQCVKTHITADDMHGISKDQNTNCIYRTDTQQVKRSRLVEGVVVTV